MIQSPNDRWEYNGDGVSTVFPYDNTIFAAENVNIYVDGIGPLTLITDYTVSGAPDYLAGNITFAAAPAAGTGNVVIQRNVPNDQLVPFPVGTSFPSAAVERAFDRCCVEIQQLATKVARSLQLGPAIAGIAQLFLSALTPGQFLRVNATGDGIELATIEASDTVVSASEAVQGIIELDTQAEVDAAADDARAVTALKLGRLMKQGAGVAIAANAIAKPADANRGGRYHITTGGGWTLNALWATANFLWPQTFIADNAGTLHNSASLILPTGADIAVAAGDTWIAVPEAGNVWRVTFYQRSDGTALVGAVVNTAATKLFLFFNFV
jgi:hypothetical protein